MKAQSRMRDGGRSAFVPAVQFRTRNSRRIYPVEFSQDTRRDIAEEVCRFVGTKGSGMLDPEFRGLVNRAMYALCDKHDIGFEDCHLDDAYVYICEQLGISYRKFKHLPERKIPVGFLEFAVSKLSGLSLAQNEIQWSIQHSKIWDCWMEWRAEECAAGRCGRGSHKNCDEVYEHPNFWEVALSIESARQDNAWLLASIDAKPRRGAAKHVSTMLQRMSVATMTASDGRRSKSTLRDSTVDVAPRDRAARGNRRAST